MAPIDRHTTDSAGAVIFRPSPDDESVFETLLIINRRGWHSFPKGHIEQGETREDAALREIAEETGVTAELLPGFCESVPSMAGDPRQVHFFLARYVEGDVKAQLEELNGARWTDAATAAELIRFDADRAVYEHAWEAWRVHIGETETTTTTQS